MNITEDTQEPKHKRDGFDHHMSTSDILMILGMVGFGMLCPLVCICGVHYYQKDPTTSDLQESLV